ncbi:MAG: ferrous iron transport protein B [Gemmataceae bacterium]
MSSPVRVALVGNPNAGKTTLFNALSGLRQRVGNYPGVTVEMKKGRAALGSTEFDLIDLPGTYSLAARSPDEMVAVDLLLGHCPGESRPDVVLAIVDASNLERHLYLTTQLLELGLPVVVALNMIDVAAGQGIVIDAAKLQERLGLPVVPIQANKGVGLDRLKQALADAAKSSPPERKPLFPEAFEKEVVSLTAALGETPPFLARRLLLDVDGYVQKRLLAEHRNGLATELAAARDRVRAANCPIPAVEARTRYGWLRENLNGCVRRPAQRPVTWTDRLDRVLTHRVWGTLLFLLLMFVVFEAIFAGAKLPMKLIGDGKDALAGLLSDAMPAGPLKSLLIDGVLEGVGGVLVFLPQILILFGFIAILEDCGYMARAAFLMDRLMSRCGLSGKSFIPMLSSVACAVPGIMATRVIENRRDRLATILVAPLMSCSARLPVYLLMIGAFVAPGRPSWVAALTMFAMYGIGLVTAPLVALLLKRTLLRGQTPVFVMEMPVYKWPSVKSVARRVFDAGWAFLRRAGTLILGTMVLVWALLYFPHKDAAGRLYENRLSEVEDEIAQTGTPLKKVEEEIGEKLKESRQADAQKAAELRAEIDELEGRVQPYYAIQQEWKSRSVLGRMGREIEPAVKPLGWDWKIGVAALASFPAREVIVGTLGILFSVGKVDADVIRDADDAGDTRLGRALRNARRGDGDTAPKLFTIPTALSVMVFFALCCQCGSTLAVIRRETRSWAWPAFTFAYMTVLAYIGALVVYQVGTLISG